MSLLIDSLRRFVPRGLRNLVRRPRASWDRALAKASYLAGTVRSVKIVPGWSARCHPMCVSEWKSFVDDEEQKAEMSAFVQRATTGMRMMDVGAHWGVFTLAARHFGGPSARCISIDASAEALRVCHINLRLNGVESDVQLINSACGSETGSLKMLTTGAGGADYLVVPTEERPDAVSVAQVTIDDVCRANAFVPTHLKIDVEGFEEEVIIGGAEVINTEKPVLFLELHGDLIRARGRDPLTVVDLLEKAGYSHWVGVRGEVLCLDDLKERNFNVRFVLNHESK